MEFVKNEDLINLSKSKLNQNVLVYIDLTKKNQTKFGVNVRCLLLKVLDSENKFIRE